MAFKLTDSKIDDLTQGLTGKIVGNKCYIKKHYLNLYLRDD